MASRNAARPLIDDESSVEDTTEAIKAIIRNWPKRFVEKVPLKSLVDYPGNPKDHDVGAISESMEHNGVVDPVIVQEWPKTPKYILSGHGRKKSLLALGVTHVDVIYVKIPPREAKRYVLAANRAQERGGWVPDALLSYMTSMSDDLMGTGFDRDDIDDLHTRIHGNDDVGNAATGSVGNVKFQVVVTCDGEDHQRELVEEFEGRGLKCRLLTL